MLGFPIDGHNINNLNVGSLSVWAQGKKVHCSWALFHETNFSIYGRVHMLLWKSRDGGTKSTKTRVLVENDLLLQGVSYIFFNVALFVYENL